MSDDVHIYPINDLRKHDTESRCCACQPRVEQYDDNAIVCVIHNSWDGREITERALDTALKAQN